jgi:fatty-acyl-CoA synthase
MTPALSYGHGTGSHPLLGHTIGQALHDAADRYGERDALVVRHQGVRLTWGQLLDASTTAARGLLSLGVRPGDRVGVWSTNRAEWVIAQFAAARCGAILVNINPAYLAGELEYALRQSGTSVLLAGDAFKAQPFAPLLDAVRPACPQLRHVLSFDDDWPALLRRGADAVAVSELERIEEALQADDPINIQYTSGTTGFPKGATLTHHNVLNNAHFTALGLGYTPDDRVCIPVPFYHCFGMVLANLGCLASGACMVVPSAWFSAPAALEAVREERCTSLYGVPTMFRAVLEVPGFDPAHCRTLRTGIMAGAPCPAELMREVVGRLHMPQVAIGYGMTETSPLSTLTALDDPLDRRVGTVGRVLPHVEVKVVDPITGRLLPRGMPGELCTRGYGVMRGYWQDPAATDAAIDAGGWMHSGDLAVMDAAGYVQIVGRLKDMIIRGGENISPREVENLLYTFPGVSEAHVVGVPSPRLGEEVVAFVRPQPGVTLDEAALAAFCRERLAAYKVPRWWRIVDGFPMTVTGKVQKFRLREQAARELNPGN